MMVVCKYYRQGNCRYGQYCQFDHINNFAGKIESYSEDEIVLTVAKEVLLADRGGQWPLSCFGPFKERPCLPGMEDLSPEEVRWDIYQAQKNGIVEQAKLRFQQMCQDMKTKRESLKNPTREMILMLKKFLGNNQKSGLNTNNTVAGKSSTFSFAAPQLGLSNNATASNVFGNKTFGMQNNPFSGGFTSATNTSVFGRPNNTAAPIFGGTANFGNNLAFGTATNTNNLFGTTTNTSTFNSIQNTQAFGTNTHQANPIFGGSSQSVFAQANVFGGTNQLNNAFVRPQTSQATTSVFDSSATPSNSLFNNPTTSQSNPSIFGRTKTTTTNIFAGSTNLQTNPVFGATTSSSSFSGGIFSQPKTLPAFGGAPVFGGVTNYTNNPGSIFGGQTFGTPAISTNNIFGSAVTTSAFGGSIATSPPAFGIGQQSVNTFGPSLSSSTPNVFSTQNSATIMSPSNGTPFGGAVTTMSSPFITAGPSFDSRNSTSSTPFVGTAFGTPAANTSDTFGIAVTSSNSPFANAGTNFTSVTATIPNASPFPASTFGNLKASPFGSTNTTVTTTTTNPFAARTQQNNAPFGSITQNLCANSDIITSPFGTSPFSTTVTGTVIDDSVYTPEGQLTDDEKSMYLADTLIMGKIPLKPPTKDLR